MALKRANQWLSSAGLRPTRQRVALAEVLIGDGKHRHVTAETLFERVKLVGEKVSLATVYNTLRAFCRAGLTQEVTVDGSKSYFDTNISEHHHFYDEDKKELIDIHDSEVEPVKINKDVPGKKIKSIEVLVKVTNK